MDRELRKILIRKEASKLLLPMIDNCLVKASSFEGRKILYGITIPKDKILGDPKTKENFVYAIWCSDPDKAIESFEQATEHDLNLSGKVTGCQIDKFEFSILEENIQ